MKTIKTDRLVLRGFCESDRDGLFELLSDEQTCLDDGGYHAYDSIENPGFLADLQYLCQSEEHYAVTLKSAGRTVGLVHVMPCHRGVKAIELGYIVNRDLRRQGIAKEAVRAVIEGAFADGVEMIVCTCYAYNTASKRTLESLGFVQEGIIRSSTNHPQHGVIDSLSYYLERR